MKKIFYFFIMCFLAKQSLALSLQEAYDIYNKSPQGKAAIFLYTDGFIKGYAKGYTWKMIQTEKGNVNAIVEEYEKCFLKSKEEKLLKNAFSYLKSPKTKPDTSLDVFLTAALIGEELECSLQIMQKTIKDTEAKNKEKTLIKSMLQKNSHRDFYR